MDEGLKKYLNSLVLDHYNGFYTILEALEQAYLRGAYDQGVEDASDEG